MTNTGKPNDHNTQTNLARGTDEERSAVSAGDQLTPQVLLYDVIVIGAGVAGLTFTLTLPPELRVALLTKGAIGESNTRYAQGGLSAAVGADDSPELHAADTIAAGAGLSDADAVETLVAGAPQAVQWLVSLGTHFDTDANGEMLLGREAAHSRRRVLHAGGDATGAEIERALVARVQEDRNVDVHAGAFVVDLIVVEGRCVGVVAELTPGAPLSVLLAPVTVLAAGGAGQLWSTTSNPPGATADGLAMAFRAGATIADPEFMQFHPTVLALPGTTPFLVSEAVRGEGAYLRDAAGERFMLAIHPQAELAPRDVVARGIHRQMAIDGRDYVDLDLRHLDPELVRQRFPTISRELAARGLDLASDLIPVAPAAHYFIGGVAASPEGVTSIPGLLALGEASATGVHGANRLASNSLLEGLVFGIAAADRLSHDWPQVAGEARSLATLDAYDVSPPRGSNSLTSADVAAWRLRLQRAMSRDVGVMRDAAGLARAQREIESVAAELEPVKAGLLHGENALRREVWELRNLVDAARAIVAAATHRRESRGAHFRADFPQVDQALDGQHSLLTKGNEIRFGSLSDVVS
jgi:L-aspartate oxidase